MTKKRTNITRSDFYQARSNSGQDSSAQSPGKLQKGCPGDATFLLMRSYVDVNKDSSYYMEAMTVLIIDNGLRISEALSIRQKDILPSMEIVIRSKKGSKNRVIPIRFNLKYWSRILSSEGWEFYHYSRWSFYRYFKKKGLYEHIAGHKTNSVTHSARHAKIRMMQNSGVDRETRANYIGHKKIKSQEYYEQKETKKS